MDGSYNYILDGFGYTPQYSSGNEDFAEQDALEKSTPNRSWLFDKYKSLHSELLRLEKVANECLANWQSKSSLMIYRQKEFIEAGGAVGENGQIVFRLEREKNRLYLGAVKDFVDADEQRQNADAAYHAACLVVSNFTKKYGSDLEGLVGSQIKKT